MVHQLISKEIVTSALTGVKYGRRRETKVLYFKKSLNKQQSRLSFMLMKYFYLFLTAVSARLKHNVRFLFQENTMYKKRKDTSTVLL